MRKIIADFNALTENESVQLGSRTISPDSGTVEIAPGDLVLLIDGDVRAYARIAEDPYYGLVALPAWDTFVDLAGEEDRDVQEVWAELRPLIQSGSCNLPEDEARVLWLLTWLDQRAPREGWAGLDPGYLPYRKARALLMLGHPELAQASAAEAVRLSPENPKYAYASLDILRRTNLDRAYGEALGTMNRENVPAEMVAACINILSDRADHVAISEREQTYRQVLEWAEAFETALDRDRISAATLALVRFNQGLGAALSRRPPSRADVLFRGAPHQPDRDRHGGGADPEHLRSPGE